MVLRRLTWPDKDANLPSLLAFCLATEGNEYSMMSKFKLGQTSLIKTGEADQQTIEDDRKFFCSELIAKCFKECNISP